MYSFTLKVSQLKQAKLHTSSRMEVEWLMYNEVKLKHNVQI